MATIIVSLSYFFCNIPNIVLVAFDLDPGINVRIMFQCINWLQFSFNFVVYAARNKQYREAYRLFLHDALFCMIATEHNSSVKVYSHSRVHRINSKTFSKMCNYFGTLFLSLRYTVSLCTAKSPKTAGDKDQNRILTTLVYTLRASAFAANPLGDWAS
jgi:hypothetical protein